MKTVVERVAPRQGDQQNIILLGLIIYVAGVLLGVWMDFFPMVVISSILFVPLTIIVQRGLMYIGNRKKAEYLSLVNADRCHIRFFDVDGSITHWLDENDCDFTIYRHIMDEINNQEYLKFNNPDDELLFKITFPEYDCNTWMNHA